jgi:hypothetical protein
MNRKGFIGLTIAVVVLAGLSVWQGLAIGSLQAQLADGGQGSSAALAGIESSLAANYKSQVAMQNMMLMEYVQSWYCLSVGDVAGAQVHSDNSQADQDELLSLLSDYDALVVSKLALLTGS